MVKNNNYLLEFLDVSHSFKQAEIAVDVLNKINFRIPKGSIVGLLGTSGSGKSTLLQLAGLLEKPKRGKIIINSKSTDNLSDGERTLLRRNNIGFVFQKSHLLAEFSALENLTIAQKILGYKNKESTIQAKNILYEMNLKNRIFHRPSKLSGGEQQRVAIARALINKPSIILADEPTGNLDANTAKYIIDLLIKSIRTSGASALIATHSLDLASKMDEIYNLEDGIITNIN